MNTQDILFIIQWWLVLFGIGIIFLPVMKVLFKDSRDSFYIFSKILGLGIISYFIFVLSSLHILTFSIPGILIVTAACFAISVFLSRTNTSLKIKVNKVIIFEELIFLIGIIIWSYVRSMEPSIHGLEKYMDFGFVNSMLRTSYFPPKDMWFTPFSINYYYFGHLITAVIIKLSNVSAPAGYNLMIATLFSFTFACSFSFLYNLLGKFEKKKMFIGGLLGGALTTFGGNLQTIYSFFQAYKGDNPVPFWQLPFQPNLFPNGYWYPNATRFIPFTIHEFPIYSFVVSDLHGHVTDIPFVLLTIALLMEIFVKKKITIIQGIFLSFFFSIMYMTNAWDGIIYLLLLFVVLFFLQFPYIEIYKTKHALLPKVKKVKGLKIFLELFVIRAGLISVCYAFFTVPFSIHFRPFVSGIGVLCAPTFLTSLQKFGPFLFEANHCQKSPFYQLFILYGFFMFFGLLFIGFITKRFINNKKRDVFLEDRQNTFIILLTMFSFFLILLPEFIYAKDIYPQHYRANTMFKLTYQAFVMLSLVSSYCIVFFSTNLKGKITKKIFLGITGFLLVLVLIYPYFSITSYYGNFISNYTFGIPTSIKPMGNLDGTLYLKDIHKGDYEAIQFINKNIQGQPIILEAQGDSYTDYARISANTGLSTVLGWTVHEWLWRGTYDIPAPRIDEVKKMYTGGTEEVASLLHKYHISLVVVGKLEKEKYPDLRVDTFDRMGRIIFSSSDNATKIYQLEVKE